MSEGATMNLAQRIAQRHLQRNGEADVPKTVKEKAEKLQKDQDYAESKAYPIAWSIFCCQNPDSDHCKQNDYFENRPEICDGIQDD